MEQENNCQCFLLYRAVKFLSSDIYMNASGQEVALSVV